MTNSTQPGRLWASVHILVSVALLGELIQTFDELRIKRAKTMARIRMLTTRLTEPMLDHLLEHATVLRPRVVRDGGGLTELEFVLVRTARAGARRTPSECTIRHFVRRCSSSSPF